ncbi:CsbD family protein [Natronosporangium hydrolyticum]|uniref:CsbD family protein n=1 Tax=Natronosporangium hydrolyticum TaxID=2811111 RepID=A0A895YF00_9ACTN|nr:CsbD family protein [Natronosporangium hydrolyticum]QSB16434.1 CsbD family protein [Natronosporangium hydrolyticum]
MDDKFENKSEEVAGKIKRKTGEVTDDPELQAEGGMQEGKSKAKQAADKAADSARDAADSVREKARQAFNRDDK